MQIDQIAVVPQPVRLSPVRGGFPLEGGLRLVANAAVRAVAARLCEDVARRTALTVEEVPPSGGRGNLFLEVRESVGEVPESYELSIGPGEIRCVGRDMAGLFYATRTLLQLLEQCNDGVLPGCVIVDRPALRYRMVLYDLAREQTCNMDYLRRVIDFLADHKYNMLNLYLEGRFAFPSHPDVGPPGVMTQQQARELDQYAAERFVELVPQVNCLAHVENILCLPAYNHMAEESGNPFQICPSHPDAVSFVTDLVEDVIPCFRTGFFHAGGDESWHLGRCPKCAERAEAEGKGGIYAEHYGKVCDMLRRNGKRVMLWGDMLLEHEGAMAGVPRDVVIFDWHYEGSWPHTVRRFRDAGFDDVFCCPATAGYGRILAPASRWSENIWSFVADGGEAGAVGTCVCAWELRLGHYFDNDRLPMLMGADRAWNPAPDDRTACLSRYTREFYGFPDGWEFLDYLKAAGEEMDALVFRNCPDGRTPIWIPRFYTDPLTDTVEKVAPHLDEALYGEIRAECDSLTARAHKLAASAVRHGDTLRMFDFPPLAWRHGAVRTYNFAQARRLREAGGEGDLRKALSLIGEIEASEGELEKRLRQAVADYGSSLEDLKRLEGERADVAAERAAIEKALAAL